MAETLRNYGHMGHKAWWEHYSHDADIGIRGHGATLEEAFEQVGLALTSVITNLDGVAKSEGPLNIECNAPDYEMMLADWINALVLEMADKNMLFRRFNVDIRGLRLRAQVWGEQLDIRKHKPTVEVKGATFTTLDVRQEPDGTWVTECIVDV